MPVEKIDIHTFISRHGLVPVIDVRSPSEFTHAHIPGAFSVPLFSDEERAVVGTAYTQQSRKAAVAHGLDFFSASMKKIQSAIEEILSAHMQKNVSAPADPSLIIHCWRGGMRSEAVAWLMSLYGYKIQILAGGYKAFRKWALSQFEKEYRVKIVGGFSGSGKTEILKELKKQGQPVIDLESLASHKGSAFGTLGQKKQPSSEMFENMLALELWKNVLHEADSRQEIWMEDESIHIGTVGIPHKLWEQMRKSDVYFLQIPFEERLSHITQVYGSFSREELIECTLKIKKRLGGANAKFVTDAFENDRFKEAFSVLLRYYDKMYGQSLENREAGGSVLKEVSCKKVNPLNAHKLINDSEVLTDKPA